MRGPDKGGARQHDFQQKLQTLMQLSSNRCSSIHSWQMKGRKVLESFLKRAHCRRHFSSIHIVGGSNLSALLLPRSKYARSTQTVCEWCMRARGVRVGALYARRMCGVHAHDARALRERGMHARLYARSTCGDVRRCTSWVRAGTARGAHGAPASRICVGYERGYACGVCRCLREIRGARGHLHHGRFRDSGEPSLIPGARCVGRAASGTDMKQRQISVGRPWCWPVRMLCSLWYITVGE